MSRKRFCAVFAAVIAICTQICAATTPITLIEAIRDHAGIPQV